MTEFLRQVAKYPSRPHRALSGALSGFFFLGLTVQPCGEPRGSSLGFDFLSVEVIQVEKKAHLSQRLNLCQRSVPSSIRGRF
jgi:hypothetical protein